MQTAAAQMYVLTASTFDASSSPHRDLSPFSSAFHSFRPLGILAAGFTDIRFDKNAELPLWVLTRLGAPFGAGGLPRGSACQRRG